MAAPDRNQKGIALQFAAWIMAAASKLGSCNSGSLSVIKPFVYMQMCPWGGTP